ncbi:MAG TPA: HAMP domain-containing sensor histidine kinase, partial [Caulobacteraceae bacterium]
MRFVSAALVALGLYVIFGWWQSWIWLGVYYAVQLAELGLNRALLKPPPQTPVLATLTAIVLYVPSALVFGAVAPVLWVAGGHYGPTLGGAILVGALTNMIVVSSGSRMAFVVASAPFAVYGLLMPLLDVGDVAGLVLGGIYFAVAMIIFNTLSAWRTTEQAYAAERDARAESDRRRLEAEAAIEAKSAFVAMICHELRTPISAITAGANELQRTATSNGAAQAELIGHAGQMMRTLLDDMLDFSRLEAGKMSVEHTPFDLRKAVADVSRMWKPQAQAKGLRLRMDGAARLPQWVSGDPTRMRQVLNNLLSNAIKFTETGAITLHLDAGPEENGRRAVTLSVEDTGPGMTPDQIERLFTPFDQLGAGTARKHGGSGLGLAISRELARLMGGDLTVTSVAGEGAAFTLNLSLEE